MTAIITKLLIIITVIISMIFPADVNGGVVADVTAEDAVIEFTLTNETGLVIAGDSWVEKLEVEFLGEWLDCGVEDAAAEGEIYVNPGDTYADSYDATLLLPGTYQLTVAYNVVTGIDGSTEIGYTVVEFEV